MMSSMIQDPMSVCGNTGDIVPDFLRQWGTGRGMDEVGTSGRGHKLYPNVVLVCSVLNVLS